MEFAPIFLSSLKNIIAAKKTPGFMAMLKLYLHRRYVSVKRPLPAEPCRITAYQASPIEDMI